MKKILLYITGFFCGMSVMAIELGASRLMAPYFSSSQIVWTIIIGTIMIAMAIGNIIGGKMADKYKNPNRLFLWIFIAACWIALIPLVGKFIIAGVALLLASSSLTSNFLVWAALLSCLLVFVFPLLVLGMVTPNLVKYAVSSLEENGKVVGTIEALNTIGSIIGTFLPTFVTIPFVGTAWTFFIFSLVLFIICLVYFFTKKFKRITFSSVTIVFLVGSLLSTQIGVAFWNNNILYEGESVYNYLRVEKSSNATILSTNVLFGVQSIKMDQDGLTGMYYDYALAANCMADYDDKIDMLILGLGTGTFAYQSNLYFSNVDVDGVEIDEKIVYLAKKYFSLPNNVNAYINDGRAFLDACKKKYDVIMVDAYQDITIPFQMSSQEFFLKVKEHLNPNGVMVVNLNMHSSNEGGINDYLCGTIKSVFSSVYGVNTNTGNSEVFASDSFDCKEKLYAKLETINKSDLQNMMNYVCSNMFEINSSKYILTDDKAPVELLGMAVLDEMIIDELNYYRNKMKGKNIFQIIEMLLNGELF